VDNREVLAVEGTLEYAVALLEVVQQVLGLFFYQLN
jgi:hypothetical protein